MRKCGDYDYTGGKKPVSIRFLEGVIVIAIFPFGRGLPKIPADCRGPDANALQTVFPDGSDLSI